MPAFIYRLQPLLDQKIRLKEQAQELLAQKQTQLRQANERLEELRAAEEALAVKKQKLRSNLLVTADGRVLSGRELRQRRQHLQTVSDELDSAKDAVFSQELFIDECKEQVEAAQRHLTNCSRDVEILNKHREKLQQRFHRELERKESLELDEIGNMLHTGRAQRI
jgi:flagellar biosynthesis chaperone FliJ